MIKNYLLAVAITCVASVSFGQIKNFTVGKVAAPVTVDGEVDAAYLASNGGVMGVLENCIDNSAADCGMAPITGCDKTTKWSAVYDDNSLFVVADVTDASIAAGDAIELFLSMDNDRTSNCPANWPRAYNAVTFQIVSSPATEATMTVTSPNGAAANVVNQAMKTTATGYVMEFELSWFDMDFLYEGALPTEGRIIGFDISNNQGGSVRTAQSMWNQNGGNRNWTDASGFGTITLGGIINSVNSLTSLVNNVTISPNPATSEARLVINAKQQDEVSIQVLNTLSQTVYSSTQTIALGNNNHTIPTAELANGIYTVVISKGNMNTTKKLVINN